MKKLTKVLSAVLLLAVVVSAFGVFSAFADDAETSTETAASERVVVWDMDDASSYTLSNANTKNNTGDSLAKTTDGGHTVWKWTHDSDKGTSAYWRVLFESPADNYDKSLVFVDVLNTTTNAAGKNTYIKNEDGTYSVKYAKNTDYAVIDFDISTDSTFISDVYFNMRHAWNTGGNLQQSGTYISLNMNKPGTNALYVGYNSGATSQYTEIVPSENKWTNVTIVYDFSADFDHEARDGDTKASAGWAGYLYIDGYYAGTMPADFFKALTGYTGSFGYGRYFKEWRVSSGTDGTNVAGSTTNFANFTVSRFPAGYNGPLTTALGNSTIHLSALDDLRYCVEGCLDGDRAAVAKITHADGTSKEVYDVDDLHGDLVSGDVVTAYVDLASLKPYYAVKMDNVNGTDTAANVIWQDVNGKALGADDALYAAPKVLDIPSAADWAIIKTDGTIYASGTNNTLATNSYKDSKGNAKWAIYDPLFDARYALDNNGSGSGGEVILFADYVGYGVGATKSVADGDTTFTDAGVTPTTTDASSSKSSFRYCEDFVYDLNGYSFTNATKVNHWATGYGGDITFKNGTVNHGTVAACSNTLMTSASGYFIFEKCEINIKQSTFLDHRNGLIIFSDCTISNTSDKHLCYAKAAGDGCTGLVIDGGSVSSVNSIMHASQASTSTSYKSGTTTIKQRPGSGNIFASFIGGADISTSAGSLFVTETYANGSAFTDDKYTKNSPYYSVNVIDASVTSYDSLVNLIVSSIPTKEPIADDVLDADGNVTSHSHTANTKTVGTLKVNCDVRIIGSDIESMILVSASPKSSDETLVDMRCNVEMIGSSAKLQRTEADESVTVGALTKIDSSNAIVTVTRTEGCMLSTLDEIYGDNCAPVIVDAAGCKWANTSFIKGGYILTTSTATYTYQYGTGEIKEIEWNSPADGTEDPVDIYAVAPLESVEGVYTYEWVQTGNAFNTKFIPDPSLRPDAKATLSLTDGFILNIYLPDNNAYSYAAKDIYGNALTGYGVTLDGAAYTKFSSKGMSPTRTENTALTLDLTVSGIYGDTAIIPIDYSVMDYISAYTADDTASDSELVKAIINYIYNAYVYAGMDTTALEQYKPEGDYTMAEDGAIIESLPGVKISVNYDEYLAWGIKATEGTRLTVSYYDYTAGTVLCEKSVIMPESGIVYVPMSAMNFASEITVTKGDQSASINLAGYYSRIIQEDAKAMVAAIYHYAKAANDYITLVPNTEAAISDGQLSADGKTLTYTDKLFIDVALDFLNTGFGAAEHIVFNNCTFLMTEEAATTYVGGGEAQGSVKSYTFDACTFKTDTANVNGKYALALVGGVNAPDYTVKNCTFNAPRGINLTAEYGAPVYGNITIEGNTFTPGDDDAPVAIEIGAAADAALAAEAIAIKNNVFECGIAVRANATLEATYASGAGLQALTGLVTFGGNTLAEYATAAADNGTDATVAIASAWSAKFR